MRFRHRDGTAVRLGLWLPAFTAAALAVGPALAGALCAPHAAITHDAPLTHHR
ncbi:hypothetical protein ACFU5Y_11160 [Streptomyces gardneri]|uniref:hypothetical protein n=1 Tax=Streptomyces gardneri TaxID=66892 RepID=UPI0036A4CFDB